MIVLAGTHYEAYQVSKAKGYKTYSVRYIGNGYYKAMTFAEYVSEADREF